MNTSSYFNYSEYSDANTPSADTPSAGPIVFDFALLANWAHADWDAFLDLTQTLRFDAGDEIFSSGQLDRAFYLVAAGQFELFYPRPDGDLRIATVDLGSILGEQCFLDGQPHSLSARAISEGELVRFSFATFETLTARQPELATQLILDLARIVSLRQRQTTTLLAG